MANFEIIFDNGGGITLQTREYVHYFGAMGGASEAAQCVSMLLDGVNTAEWEGNEPESRVEYDADVARNGGYKWIEQDYVIAALNEPNKENWLNNICGVAEDNFFKNLFKIRGFELEANELTTLVPY